MFTFIVKRVNETSLLFYKMKDMEI
jgi:hypothetical protein